jgi:hypothetical protein
MIQIILISGKQGSGKTTIANELIRQLKVLRFDYAGTEKFAETLYEMHDYLLNRMETLTGNPRIKKDGRLLQVLGTDWGRNNFGVNVWCDILKRKMDKLTWSIGSKRLIIIDDCRFENEFDTFPEALRVRLEAPEEIRKLRCPAWREDVNHASETGLDSYSFQGKFDLCLNTSGDDLTKCVSLIAAQLDKNNWIEKRKC